MGVMLNRSKTQGMLLKHCFMNTERLHLAKPTNTLDREGSRDLSVNHGEEADVVKYTCGDIAFISWRKKAR